MSDSKGWVVTSKNGRCRVHGKRCVIAGIERDRLNWTDGEGRQRFTMLAIDSKDPGRARKRAQEIVEDLAAGKVEATVSKRDVSAIFGAKDALRGTDLGPVEVCRRYRQLLDELEPLGVDPLDAVLDYARRNAIKGVPVPVAVAEMVSDLERGRKSERYVRDMRAAGNRLAQEFGAREIGSLTRREVEQFLYDWGGQPKTFNNHRGQLFTIFRWAIRKGYARVNPVEGIDKHRERRHVSCYTAKDMAKILGKTPPDLVPWVVLQAFGCLRSSEVCRVEWGKHIDLNRGIIRATEEVTKTTQTRIIEMPENLQEWLEPHRKLGGTVYIGASENSIGKKMRLEMAPVYKAAKVESIANGFRKSCASHLIPRCRHIGEAAEMMGHTVSEMKRSYRELVSAEDSEAYFGIFPRGKTRRNRKSA